jgi:hypothetical protein
VRFPHFKLKLLAGIGLPQVRGLTVTIIDSRYTAGKIHKAGSCSLEITKIRRNQMTTAYSSQVRQISTGDALKYGIIAGLGGGLIFGIMMAVMGMLPMVGMLVGQESSVVGFIVHMAISAFFGAVFGFVTARFFQGWTQILIAGVVYGIIVWVVGALVMMPLMLGMNEMVLQIGQAQWMSLIGHIIFGLITGGIFAWLSQSG